MMICPNCNRLYIPEFIESNHFAKTDNSWYQIYQECADCLLILVGIYEFDISAFESESKKGTEKMKFLKHECLIER
jgi:hypothetical protein